jgi:hypothetical protein
MKALKLTLIFLLILTIHCFGQQFNGCVVYKVEIKNPMPCEVSDSAYFEMLGGKSSYFKECYFKNSDYKSVTYTTDSPKSNELLDLTNNNLFSYIEGSDSATYKDISSTPIQINEIVRNSETEKIIGIDCQSIIFKTSMGNITYYYSDKYKISADRFAQFKHGLIDRYFLETNAVPLKIETKNAFIHTIESAIKIDTDELSDDVFKLPEFKYIEKSFF